MGRLSDDTPVTGMPLRDIRTYLAAGGDSPEAASDLLRGHLDHDLDDNDIVPAPACWRIFAEHSVRAADETHGVFGARLKLGGTTLLVARMLLAGTVLEAMRAYAEASAIMVPGLVVTLTANRTGISMRWRCEGEETPGRLVALEAHAMVYHAIFSWLAKRPLDVIRVRAPAARKGSGSTLLRQARAPIAYAGGEVEMLFAPEAASIAISPRPVEGWYDGVYRMICICASRPAASNGFTDRARAALIEGVDQQALASRWGVSTKTVARRLEQEGGSFRRIRDEVRMEKSVSLIHAGLTVEEIGDYLGYQDCRSFRRAFRRWFGVSPSQYRARPAAA